MLCFWWQMCRSAQVFEVYGAAAEMQRWQKKKKTYITKEKFFFFFQWNFSCMQRPCWRTVPIHNSCSAVISWTLKEKVPPNIKSLNLSIYLSIYHLIYLYDSGGWYLFADQCVSLHAYYYSVIRHFIDPKRKVLCQRLLQRLRVQVQLYELLVKYTTYQVFSNKHKKQPNRITMEAR